MQEMLFQSMLDVNYKDVFIQCIPQTATYSDQGSTFRPNPYFYMYILTWTCNSYVYVNLRLVTVSLPKLKILHLS